MLFPVSIPASPGKTQCQSYCHSLASYLHVRCASLKPHFTAILHVNVPKNVITISNHMSVLQYCLSVCLSVVGALRLHRRTASVLHTSRHVMSCHVALCSCPNMSLLFVLPVKRLCGGGGHGKIRENEKKYRGGIHNVLVYLHGYDWWLILWIVVCDLWNDHCVFQNKGKRSCPCDLLCGLVVRVTGYWTEMYCASCEVRTQFIYVM
jgi:hypothetical protein